jgi:plastocyanin
MSRLLPRRRAALLLVLLPAARGVAAETASITIDNFSFNPAMLTVARGTRVVWTNRDDIPHTVVSAARPPAFRSHPLDTDESFEMVFDRPGRFAYFCSLHAHMQGAVVVR